MLQEVFPGLEAEALENSSAPVCVCCSLVVRPPVKVRLLKSVQSWPFINSGLL